jgi:hypothetical protein
MQNKNDVSDVSVLTLYGKSQMDVHTTVVVVVVTGSVKSKDVTMFSFPIFLASTMILSCILLENLILE